MGVQMGYVEGLVGEHLLQACEGIVVHRCTSVSTGTRRDAQGRAGVGRRTVCA